MNLESVGINSHAVHSTESSRTVRSCVSETDVIDEKDRGNRALPGSLTIDIDGPVAIGSMRFDDDASEC